MELALRDAKARLSKIVTAAQRSERVVIAKYGEPAVELVRCRKRRGGIDFDMLEADCRRLGIKEASPEEAAAWKADFEDPAFSRKMLGLDDDEQAYEKRPESLDSGLELESGPASVGPADYFASDFES